MIHRFSIKRGEPGFSLIEVLIAIMILAIGIVGVMAALPNAYRGITRAGRVSTITHLAYQKIDQLKIAARMNWADTAIQDGDHPTPNAARMVGSSFPGYSITWKIDDDLPEPGMKRLEVEVGFRIYDNSGNPLTASHPDRIRQTFLTYLSE